MSVLASVLALVLGGHAAPPLAAARIAPPDVDALVQVRGGLRGADAGSRALARGLCDMLARTGAVDAWSRAANDVGLSPWKLFERCAGRDASLLVRRSADAADWVLALEVPQREACELLRAMGGRMQGSARFTLPRFGLAGSVIGEWLLVSDRADSPLMRDMLRVSSEPGQATLASVLPEGSFEDAGCVLSVALRHGGSAKGHSVWRAQADASGLHVDVLGSFDRDPLGEMRAARPVGGELDALPEETIACWVQPMPRDPVPAAWRRALPAWTVDEAVDRSLGGRMIVAIGPRHDGEGTAAIAVAYELRDAVEGTETQDALLDRAVRCCGEGCGACAPESVRRTQLARRHGSPLEAPRHWDAPALVARVFGGLGPMAGGELHARTVALGDGGWRVYASDAHWLSRVSASLEELPQPHAPEAPAGAPAARTGHAQGAALADLLSQWAAQRDSVGACCKPMQLMAAVVRQAGDISWRVACTAPGTWRGTFHLSPPMPSEAPGVQVADRPWPN